MLRGVLLDFHHTLVRAGSLEGWLEAASVASGDPVPAPAVPVLGTVWTRAARRDPAMSWDLDPAAHRRAFTEVLVEEAGCSPALVQALYALMPAQWVLVDGALDLLRSLRGRGLRTALVSNIALDVRPRLGELGLLLHLDAVVLSFEVGQVKPGPDIFRTALDRLGLPAEECVMVGDSPLTDGGATAAGLTTLLVPVVDDVPRLTTVAALLGAGATSL